MIDRNKRSNISMNDTIRIKKVLISMTLVGSLLMSGGIVSATDLSVSAVIAPASAVQQKANVTIDGVKQVFPQSAVIVDGSTMVPMRAIFEKLGAELKWDNNSQTATATKDGKTVSITIGKENAFVNGRSVKLAAKALLVNGNTMVPLRFVSEALGGSVKWDDNTNTARIFSAGGVVEAPVESVTKVGNISVKYVKHTYASGNQEQFDKVMNIVNKAVHENKNTDLPEWHSKYIDGERSDGSMDQSDRDRGLVVADRAIGALVEAGVSKADIAKAYKAVMIASSLANGISNPGDGSPRSAYDALVSRISDCDSDAQVYSAVYDALGFNTMIIAGAGHATVVVKIGDNWWGVDGAQFDKANVKKAVANNKNYVMSQPTYGETFSK